MRFTFVTTRQFHTISRLWFGFTASSRIQRFDREPSNSTGGTFTHEVTNFTSARSPKWSVGARPVPGRSGLDRAVVLLHELLHSRALHSVPVTFESLRALFSPR